MSYLFDLEDFGGTCREYLGAIKKSMGTEVEANREIYYNNNNTYDGYVPKQETLYFNSDGSISIYMYNNIYGTKVLFDIGEFCCSKNTTFGNTMLYIFSFAKNTLGLFKDINTDTFYWDAEKQSCRWKPIADSCSFDSYKIALNPVFDDGASFNFEKNDKSCNLTIDFSYLFKFDCETLSSLLVKPDTDPNTLETIKNLQKQLAEAETECETLSSNITSALNEYNSTYYSLESNGNYYCINEDNDGLNQLEVLLGPLKYKKFINGEPGSYTSSDLADFMTLNNQSISKFNKELLFQCEIPYGTKSDLKNEMEALEDKLVICQQNVISIQNKLAATQGTTTRSENCSSPIKNLESLDISVTLDVIESDGSVVTVTEFPLLPTIGEGNLYEYLLEKQENSGFYFCSLPKSTETWTTGCTSLMAYELTAPDGLTNTEKNLNVSTCNTVKDSLLSDLLFESPYGTSENDVKAFNKSLNKQSFASNWVNFTQLITDEETINKIKNKKIKLSISINNSCGYICVYIDNIKLTKECVNGESKKVTISKSPGFELEKVIDNKKSWVNNTTRVNRTFDIENINNLTVFRQTDYDVNDERLVINTKEIDLNINIASAIENDVQCFINDNPNLLETIPSNDCGCDLLECYEDVFNIISYSDAVNDGIIEGQIDPDDLLTTARAVRDASYKAWNELYLATGGYLDIKNGIYHPTPSDDVMTTYRATQAAYRKALQEYNFSAGGGFIEGLTVDAEFTTISEMTAYTYNNFTSYEELAPQMFNTKCGRIFKRTMISKPTANTYLDNGFLYFVETPEKELKVFWAYQAYGPKNKTWIDITSLVQEDYAPNWNYGNGTYTPEKASFFCKYIEPANYTAWLQMIAFHYQNNNNATHNRWVNPVEDSFFIEWDSTKNKCMTNMFKEVVPEQFSMHYPSISKNFWDNYYSSTSSVVAQCYVDMLLRNSGSTACTSCCSIDFTWPSIAEDIASLNRNYRNTTLKASNETKQTERTPLYELYVMDPATKMVPDETSGFIPVKVTTTIRKGSRDGEIVFKEEYVKNDPSAACTLNGANGLKKLSVQVGITDPNSAYWNPSNDSWSFINQCSGGDFGTLLSGNTSTLPLAGASNNATDRNWEFDEDYYVHFDVVNNATGYVYHVTNNDYNLKDRPLPIICPASASTQTFNINTALNSINTFKTTVLGQIQEDLDWALDACVINCGCEPNCEEDTNTYITFVDFMDDIAAIPTAEEITSVGSGSRCGCDYTSPSTVQQSYTNFGSGMSTDIDNLKYNIYDFFNSVSAYTTSKNIGFCDDVLTQPDVTLISGHTFPNNFYFKGNPYKIKGYTPCKASLLSGWTITNVGAKLSAYTDDITYIKAVSTSSQLPSTGNAGEVILVGTPSSYIGYAWDPAVNYWSTNFYNSMSNILNDIEQKRNTFIDAKMNLLYAMKPFTWSNNYLPLHSIRLWALPNTPWVSGSQIIGTNGKFSPCPYKITTEACDLLPYCGPYKHVYNNLC